MLRSNTYRQIYQSWRIRLNALPTLLVFFYRNLISISPDDASQVMDALVDCLADENVEVREMSSKVLSGIIRCSQRESIVPLKVSEPIAFVKDS
jgi:proteasome activator subunit 4